MSEIGTSAKAIADAMAQVATAMNRSFPEKEREDLIKLALQHQRTYSKNVQEMRQEGERKREHAIRAHWRRY